MSVERRALGVGRWALGVERWTFSYFGHGVVKVISNTTFIFNRMNANLIKVNIWNSDIIKYKFFHV